MYLYMSVLLQILITKVPAEAESNIFVSNQFVSLLPKKKAILKKSHNVKGMGKREYAFQQSYPQVCG